MKKISLLLLLLLLSCSTNDLSSKNVNLNFDKDLTFNEFKDLVAKYNDLSPYPDLK